MLTPLIITMENSKNQIQIYFNQDKMTQKCASCGKTFSRASNLKVHINSVHNGQKDHKCDSCGKAFSQAGHLKFHINSVHNGQKDHKCDSCGKTFSQAGNLKAHINSVHNAWSKRIQM